MNYFYGANMFGGCYNRMFMPVMNPFMAGAVNGYNSSMGNFFMMNMFNPMFSASLFSMPQINYSTYPSYNYNSNNTSTRIDSKPDVTFDSSAYSKASSDWSSAYSSLMNTLTGKNKKPAVSSEKSSSKSAASSSSTAVSKTSVSSSTSVSSTAAASEMSNLKKNLSPEFISKTKEVANKLNCDWQDLMALMQAESGINPQAWNGNSAVGLIQFTDYSVADLNRVYGLDLTKEKIAQMSGIEQLDLVEKYLTLAKSYSFSSSEKLSAGDLYAITFLPGRARRDVLATRGEAYYVCNPIDEDNDGVISKRDLETRLNRKRLEVFA
ncbi:MAG: transglycosylase SLT domain-containing protein [Brachyspira sp.]|jgi:hypothetical protein|nr:transglycosylase SLT domain-containing protein [Brachyspira sp.]